MQQNNQLENNQLENNQLENNQLENKQIDKLLKNEEKRVYFNNIPLEYLLFYIKSLSFNQINKKIITYSSIEGDVYIDNYIRTYLTDHEIINLGNIEELILNNNIDNNNELKIIEQKDTEKILLIKYLNNDLNNNLDNNLNDDLKIDLIKKINPKYIILFGTFYFNDQESSIIKLTNIYNCINSYAIYMTSVGEDCLYILTKNINENPTINIKMPIYEYNRENDPTCQDDILEKKYNLDLFPNNYYN